MNAATNNAATPQPDTEAAPSPQEKTDTAPNGQDKYNPMAQIIERHESAVNRIKHGK